MKVKEFIKKYSIWIILVIVLISSIIVGSVLINNKNDLKNDKIIEQEKTNNIIDKTDEDIINDNQEDTDNELNNEVNTDDLLDDANNSVNQEEQNNKDSNENNNNSNAGNNSNSSSTTNDKSNSNANNNNNSTTNNGNSSNNSNTNNSNTSNDNNSDDKQEEVVLTQAELNNQYRNKLQTMYGITIAYGDEMGSYLIGYYSPTKMTYDTEINEYLTRIETELKKYPTGFFKEMKNFGMPLTLYIVKDIPNSGIAGLTDSQFADNIIISIKSGLLFEKTLNHEIMHYIDAYLKIKMYPEDLESIWNELNPDNYTYGSFDTSLDFLTTQNNNSYFLSNYAQTNWREDRATLFEDLMTRSLKRSCYTEGTPLYNKIKTIAEQIDKYYDCVNSSTTEYWERFL